jgi:hypothetical protein
MTLTIYALQATVEETYKHGVHRYVLYGARRWSLLVAFFTGKLKLHRGDRGAPEEGEGK